MLDSFLPNNSEDISHWLRERAPAPSHWLGIYQPGPLSSDKPARRYSIVVKVAAGWESKNPGPRAQGTPHVPDRKAIIPYQ